MAVISKKQQDGTYLNTDSVDYTPSQQVQDAQKQMQQYQAQQPAAYTPSQQVQAAQQAMEQAQAAKPQGYTSKYGPALDNIIQQIQNQKDYKYEFNGDEMFKYYADLYGQNAKQASMNAMGQAAALTGGYGNSYAQQVGNQAYNEEMRKLYEAGMQLQQQAYQRYQDQRADQYNQYGVLSGEEGKEHDRYNDEYNKWLQEREYATGQYDKERSTDYGMYRDTVGDYQNNRDYYTNLYQTEADRDYSRFEDQRDYNEKVREFDASLNWEKMSASQKYAAEYAMSILQNGQMPSEVLLLQAGLSAEDAQKMMAQLSSGGGGGGSSKKTYYVDKTGRYFTIDKSGNVKLVDKKDVPADASKYNINKAYETTDLANQALHLEEQKKNKVFSTKYN